MVSGLVYTNIQTHNDEKGKPELVFDDEVPKCLHGISLQWFSPLLNTNTVKQSNLIVEIATLE